MHNRRTIMRRAWEILRRDYAGLDWGRYVRPHLRLILSRSLTKAWAEAKSADPSRDAMQAEIVSLRGQIEALSFKSLRYDTARMAEPMRSRIAALETTLAP